MSFAQFELLGYKKEDPSIEPIVIFESEPTLYSHGVDLTTLSKLSEEGDF